MTKVRNYIMRYDSDSFTFDTEENLLKKKLTSYDNEVILIGIPKIALLKRLEKTGIKITIYGGDRGKNLDNLLTKVSSDSEKQSKIWAKKWDSLDRNDKTAIKKLGSPLSDFEKKVKKLLK